VGTHVAPGGVTLGAVPALPILAPLPARTPPGLLAWVPYAVPLLAGVVVAALVLRREPAAEPRRVGLLCLGGGAVAGGCLAVLAAASAGAAGAGRMAEVGPVWWQVGPAVALEVGALAAALAAALRQWSLAGRAGR
jgi:hypothetical protein